MFQIHVLIVYVSLIKSSIYFTIFRIIIVRKYSSSRINNYLKAFIDQIIDI